MALPSWNSAHFRFDSLEAWKMSHLLLDLPSQLLHQILTYDDTTHLSLPLWLICNKALQHILANSVSFVELRNVRQQLVFKLPLYLVQLRALRHLLIDRATSQEYLPVYDPHRAVEVLQNLPKEMETLILRFANSKLLFFPDAAIDLPSTYPSLVRLYLDKEQGWMPSEVKSLPRSITDLRVVSYQVPSDKFLEALPPMLETLHLICTAIEDVGSKTFFEKLPPHLRTLTISKYYGERSSNYAPETFAAMPRSLTSLDLYSEIQFLREWHLRGTRPITEGLERTALQYFEIKFTPEIAAVVPPYLSHCWVSYSKDKNVPRVIASLPDRLQSFGMTKVFLEPKDIRLLPRGLTELEARITKTKKLLTGDFPPALRRLTLAAKKGLTPQVLSLLPPIMMFKSRELLDMALISHLPSSILELQLILHNVDDTVQFPPTLTRLSVESECLAVWHPIAAYKGPKKKKGGGNPSSSISSSDPSPDGSRVLKAFPFASLPKTLRHLILSNFWIPISHVLLPPFILTLRLEQLFVDADYDPKDPKLLAHARYLREEARETDSYAFRWNEDSDVESISVFDLIPRNITYLTLVRLDPPQPIEFKRLPRTLKHLYLENHLLSDEPLDPDILLYLPKESLLSLKLSLHPFQDHHLAALPRKLSSLTLIAPHGVKVTEACLKYIPIDSWGAWMNRVPHVKRIWDQFLSQFSNSTIELDGLQMSKLLKENRAPWLSDPEWRP